MKSAFYVATVVNAYRKAIDAVSEGRFTAELACELQAELNKASHREYTTGFYFDEEETRQYYESSKAVEEYKFIAVVTEVGNGYIVVEQRNKFVVGDTLETLSVTTDHNRSFVVHEAFDKDGQPLSVMNKVKQIVRIDCPCNLAVGDILRKPMTDK